MTTEQHKKPDTNGISGKIAVLERRVDHLHRRLEKNDYQNSSSADYDRAECAALIAAIDCMRYVLNS